jgi:hypothetical protein
MTRAAVQRAAWRRFLPGAIVLLCLPWLAFSARHALRAGHDCDIWRQWTVSRYVFAGINPYAISLGILEKNYGKMSGENRRRLKDFVIYEVHPSLDTTGVPNFQPAFGSPTATYPPSSLLMISLLGGWLPAGAVHGAWLGLSLVALLLLGRHLRGPPEAPVAGGLAVCAVLLVWPPIHESIRTLQFIVPVTWFVALMVRNLDRRPYLAALCLAAALIKPSVALPFTLLPLVRGRWTVVALAGALHLAATLAMGALVHTPPLDMLRDWLKIPGYMLQGTYSLQEVINGLGWDNTPKGLALSLGFAGACAVWAALHRRARPADLAAFLALASLIWTYHERYDSVLLLLPLMNLFARLAQGPTDRLDLLLAAAFVVLGLALTDAVYLQDLPGLRLLRWGGRAAMVVLFAGTARWVWRSHREAGTADVLLAAARPIR